MAGCQVVRLSGAGASLVRRGEMGVAVLLVVRRVNYSEQLQIGRWGGGRLKMREPTPAKSFIEAIRG